MQFAVIPGNSDIEPKLFAAIEYQALMHRYDITDEPADEAAFVWHVAYGHFMPQPSLDPRKATEELKSYEGAGFGRVTKGRTCRISEVRAIELFPMVNLGQSSSFPCAVLIGTTDMIPSRKASQALALFPRFINEMDVLTNTINRPGILALKSEARNAIAKLNPDPSAVDWRQYIERDKIPERIG